MTAGDKQKIRKTLMVAGPTVALAVAGFFWVLSGRYIATDNAYVKEHKIMVSPEVSGPILPVGVHENQEVHKGDTLFSIDPAPFRIARDKAAANLESVRLQIDELRASLRQKDQELVSAKQDADYAETQYNRRNTLSMKAAVSEESLDSARHERDVTHTKVTQLEQERAAIVAQLAGDENIRTEDHPLYKAAQASLDAAQLDLDRTVVKAPVDGVTGAMPNGGDYAHAGIPVLSVVEKGDVWLEANYKETEVTDIRPGQKVEIEVDTYPGRKWHGTVQSISPATGSEFSVLPAQNATGNWVKVVQRIAVRIHPKTQEGEPPLRTGMSATVTVDTGSYPHLPGAAWAKEKP